MIFSIKKILIAFSFIVLGAFNFAFDCPSSEGFFPDPDNCENFYQCSSGVANLKTCPAGLHFNATTEVCDWPESAGCDAEGGAKKFKGSLCYCADGATGAKLICTNGNLDPCTSSLSCYKQQGLGAVICTEK